MPEHELLRTLLNHRTVATPEEARIFESTLEELAKTPVDTGYLPQLFMAFYDKAIHIEVMWSLVAYIEAIEPEKWIPAFLRNLNKFEKGGLQWRETLLSRLLNSDQTYRILADQYKEINEDQRRTVGKILDQICHSNYSSEDQSRRIRTRISDMYD